MTLGWQTKSSRTSQEHTTNHAWGTAHFNHHRHPDTSSDGVLLRLPTRDVSSTGSGSSGSRVRLSFGVTVFLKLCFPRFHSASSVDDEVTLPEEWSSGSCAPAARAHHLHTL